ncbi:MAG: response regulator [Rhodanobacter sp.]
MPQPHALPPSHPAPMPQPRVLLADDDPASCRFLYDGMQSLGAAVESHADGSSALARARSETFDLLMLDCQMPPGPGALQILTQLRDDPQAASRDSLAVASSAELGADVRQSLFAAGFGELLLKPCGLMDLQRILGLLQPGRHGVPLLDDDAALTTTGNIVTMRAMRLLLRDELIQLERELDQLSQDRVGFGERLHRLRSSCGFCGANALSAQVVVLQRQLAATATISLTRFRTALRATLQALDR